MADKIETDQLIKPAPFMCTVYIINCFEICILSSLIIARFGGKLQGLPGHVGNRGKQGTPGLMGLPGKTVSFILK